MPSIYGACDIDVTPPVCNACAEPELGGVRGIAFVHTSVYAQVIANPSNAAIWDMLRSQGLIFIVPETRGTFNGGEIITQNGFGDRATKNVGFNFSLEYDDPAYIDNCPFYNLLMQSGSYHVALKTETQVKISDKPVEVVPTAPITDDITEQATWHIIVTWTGKLQPCAFDAPEDIFICVNATDRPIPIILNNNVQKFLSAQATAASFAGERVQTGGMAAQIIVANMQLINGVPTIVNSLGGDVVFLISERFDIEGGELPQPSQLTPFATMHYYGAQAQVQSDIVNFSTQCGYNGGEVTALATPCECLGADPLFFEKQQEGYGKRLMKVPNATEGNKVYFIGIYVKGVGMGGGYYNQLLMINTSHIATDEQDAQDPCTNGAGFFEDVAWSLAPWNP